MWWMAAALAGPYGTGGVGFGVTAPTNALGRYGVVGSASGEVREAIEPVPWLGFGFELATGFVPKHCTRCEVQALIRAGIGPHLVTPIGEFLIGPRIATRGDLTRIRPFIRTSTNLPIGGIVLRPYLWLEGITALEVGIGLELGFEVREGFRVAGTTKKSSAPETPPTPDPDSEPEPEPEQEPEP